MWGDVRYNHPRLLFFMGGSGFKGGIFSRGFIEVSESDLEPVFWPCLIAKIDETTLADLYMYISLCI